MRQQLFGAVLIGGFQVKFQISAEIGKACDILLKFALFSVIQLRIVGCGNAAEIRPGQREKRAVRNPSASAPEAGEKPFPGISRLEECPLSRLTREALIKSARAGSEIFFSRRRFQKRRNTLCISHFSNRRLGGKRSAIQPQTICSEFP